MSVTSCLLQHCALLSISRWFYCTKYAHTWHYCSNLKRSLNNTYFPYIDNRSKKKLLRLKWVCYDLSFIVLYSVDKKKIELCACFVCVCVCCRSYMFIQSLWLILSPALLSLSIFIIVFWARFLSCALNIVLRHSPLKHCKHLLQIDNILLFLLFCFHIFLLLMFELHFEQ